MTDWDVQIVPAEIRIILTAAVHFAACRDLQGNKLTGKLSDQLFRHHPMLRNLQVTGCT